MRAPTFVSLLLTISVGCTSAPQPLPGPSPSPTAALTQRFREDDFTIRVPEGWKRYVERSGDQTVIGFRSEAGRYFEVILLAPRPGAPPGAEREQRVIPWEPAYDSTWTIVRNTYDDGPGLLFTGKHAPCTHEEFPHCLVGDGRMQVAVFFDRTESEIYTRDGSQFNFFFGDNRSEQGNTDVFKQIIESFRVPRFY